MNRVYPKLRTVRELLSAKYAVDFYQREYVWDNQNIEELLTDLENKFLVEFNPKHEREKVADYSHYFLGTIITCTEGSKKNIVDGQQRLTTLTLLLIFLHHLQQGREDNVNVRDLILAVSYGKKSFNLDVPERNECMQALFETGSYDVVAQHNRSVANLVDRYADIQEKFPESLRNGVLPYFVDWLVDNVDLVEIETATDDDAFTIFETMNDRGTKLGPTDMLKGYLLGNINEMDDEEENRRKQEANDVWKTRITELEQVSPGKDIDFFKDWLRAKYADTMRDRKRGAVNKDFENINKFHRWVRDEKQRIGLSHSSDYYDFITRKFARFSNIYLEILRASETFSPELDYVYFNAHNEFTLQPALLLAPLRIEDDGETMLRKIRLVAGFIDIFTVRRIVNFRTRSYSSIVYTVFNLMKRIRDLDLWELAEILKEEVNDIPETFDGMRNFYLHQQNRRSTHHVLARMTYHIEQQSGIASSFENYISREIKKPFEIEHLWGNVYEEHTDEFPNVDAFQEYRNRIGGLVLVPRGFNQSFGADTYEAKLTHYNAQNLLARSLHPLCYQKNPSFLNYVNISGLPFRAHPEFKKADLDARQELYRQICEEIWSPARFDRELL